MKENFNMLDKSGKNRIIIFTVITIIAAMFAVACIWALYRAVKDPLFNIGDIMNENIDFDGENFNWFFALLATLINMLIVLFTTVVPVVFSFIIDILFYGLFKAIIFPKTNFASEAEYVLAKQMLTIILIVSIVVSLFMIHFDFIFVIFMICPIFFMWLFGYLFYIYPLKNRGQK